MIPEFTDEATFRDLLDPAMDIAKRGDVEEATEFTRRYVEYLRRSNPDWSVEEARACVMANVGYYAGYYDHETMRQVHEVFGAEHPFLGVSQPTAEEAFDAGRRWAAHRDEKEEQR